MNTLILSQANRTNISSISSPVKVHNAISFNDLLTSYTGELSRPKNSSLPSPSLIHTEAITTAEIPHWDHLDYSLNQGSSTLSIHTSESFNFKEVAVSSPTTQIPLGVINEKVPTVSQLLKAHPTLQGETWNILSSVVNRGKDFTKIPAGTVVQIDPVTKEISWRQSRQIQRESQSAIHSIETSDVGRITKTKSKTAVDRQAISQNNKKSSLFGTIDETSNTVFQLLAKHPGLRDDAHNHISSKVSRNNPFHHNAKGTEISLQPETGEITSGPVNIKKSVSERPDSVKPATVHRHSAVSKDTNNPVNLTEAVQPFLGKSYQDIDCYGLLVKGLRRMGIPYVGENGLLTKLTRMAHDKGMSANTYLNGEGIVEAIGSQILIKKYPNMSNWKQDAEKLFDEMKPLLDKGQILSFSTEKHGHTGIISRQEQQWTFINSGRLDNTVAANSRQQGVGEEILHKEISNWFKLAHSKRETLTVTLGQLRQDKIHTALNVSHSLSTQI